MDTPDSMMIIAAVAIERRDLPGPGRFRIGFTDGVIECVREGTPAPGFIEVCKLTNDQIIKGFTAKQWLVLACKLNHIFKEKVLCQKLCKS